MIRLLALIIFWVCLCGFTVQFAASKPYPLKCSVISKNIVFPKTVFIGNFQPKYDALPIMKFASILSSQINKVFRSKRGRLRTDLNESFGGYNTFRPLNMMWGFNWLWARFILSDVRNNVQSSVGHHFVCGSIAKVLQFNNHAPKPTCVHTSTRSLTIPFNAFYTEDRSIDASKMSFALLQCLLRFHQRVFHGLPLLTRSFSLGFSGFPL